MTPAVQKWLALAGAVLVVAVFVAANAHLLAVAIGSQPGCVVDKAKAPAKRAC